MENKQPLLSICIPTYNGGEKLKLALTAVFTALEGYTDVEVIVSDNHSTDDTPEFVSAFYHHSQFYYYRNDNNLGFNRNLGLLLYKYAQGKYCWVIGDDDLLDEDVLSSVWNLLVNDNVEYISLAHRLLTITDYKKMNLEKNRKIHYRICSFVEAIEYNSCDSNILGTFMSSSIFLLDRVKQNDYSIFSDNSWDNFYSTFPNSYLMVSSFAQNNHCVAITTPVLTALIHEKSWDDKMNLLTFKYLPAMYVYHFKKTGKTMSNNLKLIQQMIVQRIGVLLKHGWLRDIPISLLFKSIFWKNTYILLLHKIK